MEKEMAQWKELLFDKSANVYDRMDEKTQLAMEEYAHGYMRFLNSAKTEREAVVFAVAEAKKHGFTEYHFGQVIEKGGKYYYNNRGKAIYLFQIGSAPITEGIRISAAHIDSPRIDLKQRPVYEDGEMCFFKTHYYGGIKKYQWTAIPLALHGTVVLKNGKSVDIAIGEEERDPVFYINDLLPHLSREQYSKTVSQAIDGETLNVLVGGYPFKDEDVKDTIKLTVLKHLHDEFGMEESDFLSAELCVVPAFKARDIGFDRALVGGYGHDDRVCSYPALTALLADKNDEHTVMVVLADKEEIGSEGNTGMQCKVYEDLIDVIAASQNQPSALVRANSVCLSADVTAGYDPNFAGVYEKRNSSLVSYGTSVCKFTGSGGKGGSNDASAELCGRVRKIFDDNGVVWQTAELGKVDAGGGGTVAKFLAKLNIDTIDIGVPVISMHAPYEVISKGDLYSTYEAFAAFIK
ncbi:MAG TPA: aminopeptidase [Treponema sp.]|nr:aminopeptidase [Treponema sp.]